MPNSTDNRGLKNGKRYRTSIERILRNHGSTEEIAKKCSSENVEREIPEFQTWTHEGVKEQIRGFIAPQTRQLEELTRLVQGMTTSWHPSSSPGIELGTISVLVQACLSPTWWHESNQPNIGDDQWPAPTRTTKQHIRITTNASDPKRRPKWPTRMNISSTPLRTYRAEYAPTVPDYYRRRSQSSEERKKVSRRSSTYKKTICDSSTTN